MNISNTKIAFYTLGCKLNFSESSSISNSLIGEGFELVNFKDFSDVYIINTCTVTQVADSKCRTAIRQAKRRNPNAIVAVIGCYAQVNPDEIARIEGVDIILGNKEKYNLINYLKQYPNASKNIVIAKEDFKNDDLFVPTYSLNDRTRCFFKIQDGCNFFCSYCKVPFARGKSRSANINETLDIARHIKKNTDIKELVLTGINVGEFGKNHHENLFKLLIAIEREQLFPRIRLSSIEPELITDEIIDLFANSKIFMPHFHIPLQSGSNEVLKYMKRHYNTDFFERKINQIQSKIKNVCIAIDVIAGFPGENDNLFLETYNFIEQLKISYLHIFTYSDRDGTLASTMNNKIDTKTKNTRSKKLHQLGLKKSKEFYTQNIGIEQEVLFESSNQNGFISGFTSNYIKVKTTFDAQLVNSIKKVKLSNIGNNGSYMEINK